jgi:hypothetical protein
MSLTLEVTDFVHDRQWSEFLSEGLPQVGVLQLFIRRSIPRL